MLVLRCLIDVTVFAKIEIRASIAMVLPIKNRTDATDIASVVLENVLLRVGSISLAPNFPVLLSLVGLLKFR